MPSTKARWVSTSVSNRIWRFAISLCILSLAATPASAQLESVALEIFPLLGRNAVAANASTPFVVTLKSSASYPIVAELVLRRNGAANETKHKELLRKSINLDNDNNTRSHVLRITQSHETRVLALLESDQGRLLARANVQLRDADTPFLFELARSPKLVKRLDGRLLPSPVGSTSQTSLFPVAVSHPVVSSGTRPNYPTTASDYAAVSLAATTSTELFSLNPDEVRALSRWIAAGGSLALSLDNPVHKEHPPFTDFTGGPCATNPPGEALLDVSPYHMPTVAHSSRKEDLKVLVEPLPTELIPYLAICTGANLRSSVWGSSAAYGLGEVHVLGFNYNEPRFINSEWAQLRLLDLVGHAVEHRRAALLPLGRQEATSLLGGSLHSLLAERRTPNWLLYAAFALVLLLGAAAFHLSRSHYDKALTRNLQSLARQLQHLALLTLVVCLGMLYLRVRNPSNRARARHITLLEAGAGVSLAKINRFRSFQTENTENLTVSTINPYNTINAIDPYRTLRLSYRSRGTRLELMGTNDPPLEPMVFQEFGLVGIGRGVWLEEHNNSVQISNFMGRDLLSVVARSTEGELFFFKRISDGEVAQLSSGLRLRGHGSPPPGEESPLLGHLFFSHADDVTPGISDVLNAIAELAGTEVDFWPHDVPVLLAQLDGGEGITADHNLLVESSRTILRVVGYGSGVQ